MKDNTLKYHHCRSLDSVIFGEINANPEYFWESHKSAYLWLEKELGFYPIFLSVGTTDEDIRMTGYQKQFQKIISRSNKGNTYRKKAEFPNYVLFSFEEIDGVFTDYNAWNMILISGNKDGNITQYEKRLILKPSWNKSKWLNHAKKHPYHVQLVTDKLDLTLAKRIFVRNKITKNLLEDMGFNQVSVKRLKVDQ